MAYLYRHIRHDTNQVFYVGIGTDKKYRRANRKSGRNNLWNKISSKTGYSVEIMIDNLELSDVLEKEKEFIKLYGRIDQGSGTLANLTDGGDGVVGWIPTQETKLKLALANLGKKASDATKKKMSKSQTGRTHSEDTIKKIKSYRQGKHLSEEHIEKMRIGKQKLTISQAEDIKKLRSINVPYSDISKMFKCSHKTIYNLVKGLTYKNIANG